MSETAFGSWSVAESPVTIEYSLVVIEEIRHQVTDGFQRLSRGGLEVGGVLYGVRDGRTVRVLAIREIACEHARGPAFLLSDRDRAELTAQLDAGERDARLEGMICVGWFLSHTRSEILLSESDQEVFASFFPAPWQVTLVIHPGRIGSMRAGFFIREADGTVMSERSYLNFNFPERAVGATTRLPFTPDRKAVDRRPPIQREDDAPAEPLVEREAPRISAPLDGPRLLPEQPRPKWPWLVAWALVVCAAGAFGFRYFTQAKPTESFDLSVLERAGQLNIAWNHLAKPITTAAHATLQITDGKEEIAKNLSPQDLQTGSFSYARKTGDVQVRMTVENPAGAKVEEASRFLGREPAKTADPAEVVALKKERDALEAEIARLKTQNDQQAGRIQTLERTLRILQSR